MKQETKRKWKTYAKILIPIVLVLGVISYCLLTMNVQGLPDKSSVENRDLSKRFQEAIDSNSILTLTGTDKEADYEWFYAENTITSSNRTDMKVYFTHEYDEFVAQKLQVTNVLGFYFAEDIDLNGYPTLTIIIPNWDAKNVDLYKLVNKRLTKVDIALAVNTDDKGRKQVAFQVYETDGIYFFTGGSHNFNLQGQGNANHIKPVVDDKDNGKHKKEPSAKDKTSKEHAGNKKKKPSVTDKNTSNSDDSLVSDKNENDSQINDSQTTSGQENENSQNTNPSRKNDKKYVNDVKPSGKEVKLVSVIKRILSDGSRTEQDQYKTDPVPIGKPEPVEPDKVQINYKKTYTCTLSIDCRTILNNRKDLTEGKEKLVPKDGWILKKSNVLFYEGESVFDVLLRETQKRSIQMEYTMTPMYNSNYIEGISNLYEFDCGNASGWMYKVNGWYPNYGCSRYQLQENDVIEWRYTCDYGVDVGCDMIVNN